MNGFNIFGICLKHIGALLLALALTTPSHAREPVPIVDYVDTPVATGSGRQITVQQIQEAIVAAARSLSWDVSVSPSDAPPLVLATLVVRGKHTVEVSIPYSTQAFSVKYRGSRNMKYSQARDANQILEPGKVSPVREGTPLIHPYYNRWAGDLHEAIRRELRKL